MGPIWLALQCLKLVNKNNLLGIMGIYKLLILAEKYSKFIVIFILKSYLTLSKHEIMRAVRL